MTQTTVHSAGNQVNIDIFSISNPKFKQDHSSHQAYAVHLNYTVLQFYLYWIPKFPFFNFSKSSKYYKFKSVFYQGTYDISIKLKITSGLEIYVYYFFLKRFCAFISYEGSVRQSVKGLGEKCRF